LRSRPIPLMRVYQTPGESKPVSPTRSERLARIVDVLFGALILGLGSLLILGLGVGLATGQYRNGVGGLDYWQTIAVGFPLGALLVSCGALVLLCH
jgi:hypothetical protein